MLNNLYDNIGEKLKKLSITIFLIETISAIIAGIALISSDDDYLMLGVLLIICVPILSLLSSWILYALGELVEDIHEIRNQINSKNKDNHSQTIDATSLRKASQCECGEMFYGLYCPVCGKRAPK